MTCLWLMPPGVFLQMTYHLNTVRITVNLANWVWALVWSYSTWVQICQDSWVPVYFQVHQQLSPWRSSGFLGAQVLLADMMPRLLGVLGDDIQAAETARLTVTWVWSPRADPDLGISPTFLATVACLQETKLTYSQQGSPKVGETMRCYHKTVKNAVTRVLLWDVESNLVLNWAMWEQEQNCHRPHKCFSLCASG